MSLKDPFFDWETTKKRSPHAFEGDTLFVLKFLINGFRSPYYSNYIWNQGEGNVSSRQSTRITGYEKSNGRIDDGFHSILPVDRLIEFDHSTRHFFLGKINKEDFVASGHGLYDHPNVVSTKLWIGTSYITTIGQRTLFSKEGHTSLYSSKTLFDISQFVNLLKEELQCKS